MGVEKKVTVKPFLNQLVKGRIVKFDEGELYPLYFRVTYNRKTTRFPAGNNWFPLSMEKHLDSSEDINRALKGVENIAKYEIDRVADFEIKGIGDKVKSYVSPFPDSAVRIFFKAMEGCLKKAVSSKDFELWQKAQISEKVEIGFRLLGSNIPDDLGRIYFLVSTIVQVFPTSYTLQSWLIEKEDREKGIDSLRAYQKALNGSKVCPGLYGYHVAYSYSLDIEKTIEGFDVVAHLVIDNGVHSTPEVRSMRYEEGRGILQVQLKK